MAETINWLEKEFQWVEKEARGFPLVEQALRDYGQHEVTGPGANVAITRMAQELGGEVAKFYNSDEIPWCALALNAWWKRAGGQSLPGMAAVRAKDCVGLGIAGPTDPEFGDVCGFTRQGGGHVGLYVGEDAATYYILGANQGNKVSIVRIKKDRLSFVRRFPNQSGKPRRITLASDGQISHNEA